MTSDRSGDLGSPAERCSKSRSAEPQRAAGRALLICRVAPLVGSASTTMSSSRVIFNEGISSVQRMGFTPT
jgi:hypothetical protein